MRERLGILAQRTRDAQESAKVEGEARDRAIREAADGLMTFADIAAATDLSPTWVKRVVSGYEPKP